MRHLRFHHVAAQPVHKLLGGDELLAELHRHHLLVVRLDDLHVPDRPAQAVNSAEHRAESAEALRDFPAAEHGEQEGSVAVPADAGEVRADPLDALFEGRLVVAHAHRVENVMNEILVESLLLHQVDELAVVGELPEVVLLIPAVGRFIELHALRHELHQQPLLDDRNVLLGEDVGSGARNDVELSVQRGEDFVDRSELSVATDVGGYQQIHQLTVAVVHLKQQNLNFFVDLQEFLKF